MSRARRGVIAVGAAVSAALSLSACQTLAPTIHPAGCIAARAYQASLDPASAYHHRAAASAAVAAACSAP